MTTRLTSRQVELVQRTFELLRPVADTAVALFYRRMFALDPSLRRLFPRDMAAQRQKLIDTLATAVRRLENPDDFRATLVQLGRRHVIYGVQPAHYQTMGQALLWMLATALGDHFTDEMRNAWQAVYDVLAAEMIAAAANREQLITEIS